ncbi:alpha/beta hydrolase [Streptomyces sp. NPDC048281]|uniref:alpha/beta hydrolase n=1 Tax=Streptomyces sp. NPDC048281 TaxID=3154715 RepID=UPI0034227B80
MLPDDQVATVIPAQGVAAEAELARAVEWTRELKRRTRDCADLTEVRAVTGRMMATRLGEGPPAGVRIAQAAFGGVPAEVVTADGAPPAGPVLLHLHGGGFMLGAPPDDRLFLSGVATGIRGRTVSVDYRLAPENPYPAAVDDGVAVYEALLRSGVDPNSLVVSGESAGGGLALLCLQRAHRIGLPRPAGLVLLSPLADFTLSGASHETNAEGERFTSREGLARGLASFLAGADAHAVSPLANDLAGIPPSLVQAGDTEILLDDARGVAAGLRSAGVPVALEIWGGVLHTWHGFPHMTAAQRATTHVVRFLRERLGSC